MNQLLDKLHDIEGLDFISQWPLGIGVWILIIIAFLVLGTISVYFISYKLSWRSEARKKLSQLEKNLTDDNARETVTTLSEYLRRIAIYRFSRKECAGLAGKDWLFWLSKNDPKKFDWEKKGRLIVDIPYAPSDYDLPLDQIKDLIQAVRNWVR